jgi:hypothetical protein
MRCVALTAMLLGDSGKCVVQGRQSISWANSVLPVFMAASGRKTERLPELPCAIQIDTTRSRLESNVLCGFQRFALSFSRTAVMICRIGIIHSKTTDRLRASN